MSRVHRPRRCTSYAAGHTVHWIQALHPANKPEVARRTRKGTLTAVDGDLLTIRFPGGGVPERFHNHEPRRLLAIARRLPAAVSLNDEYCILRVRTYCFSVRPARGPPPGMSGSWSRRCTAASRRRPLLCVKMSRPESDAALLTGPRSPTASGAAG